MTSNIVYHGQPTQMASTQLQIRTQTLEVAKAHIDNSLFFLLPPDVSWLTLIDHFHEHILFRYVRGAEGNHGTVIARSAEIDNMDYVGLAVDRVRDLLGLSFGGGGHLVLEEHIDPIYRDLMEGRGLQDYMEET